MRELAPSKCPVMFLFTVMVTMFPVEDFLNWKYYFWKDIKSLFKTIKPKQNPENDNSS